MQFFMFTHCQPNSRCVAREKRWRTASSPVPNSRVATENNNKKVAFAFLFPFLLKLPFPFLLLPLSLLFSLPIPTNFHWCLLLCIYLAKKEVLCERKESKTKKHIVILRMLPVGNVLHHSYLRCTMHWSRWRVNCLLQRSEEPVLQDRCNSLAWPVLPSCWTSATPGCCLNTSGWWREKQRKLKQINLGDKKKSGGGWAFYAYLLILIIL